jgi:hypothetical protein
MRTRLRTDESGMALLTVMLVSMLACALMAGVFAAINADQRSLGLDRDQSQAYSAAHAGLEKLTTQLAQLFVTDFSPSAAQITTASAVSPAIPGFNFVAPGGGPGYTVTFNADPCSCPNAGNPLPSTSNDITTGPFAGFKGLITPYTLTVTARSTGGGSEVRLRREVQTVAVPVFQFGIFGERSLSFHAGANFDFGGRVHTNEHLFLAEGSGATLTFRDKMTAIGQVVRSELENGNAITASGHTGTVTIPTVIGSSYRNLSASEGSVSGGPTSSPVDGWKNLSEVTYATNIRNTMTGAKRLDLPLVSQGARPIDLIRRPALNSNENVTNAPVFGQRYFAMASLRILLSDRVADLTNLPTVTATAPIALDSTWVPPAGMPQVARSIGPALATTAITGTGGTPGSGTGTITLGSVPNWLRMGGVSSPTFTIGTSTVTACTELTATQIRNCSVSGASTPLNTNFNVTLASGEVVTFRTASSGSATTGSGKNITLVSTQGLAWGTRLLYASGNNVPLSCSGYNTATNQLNGCYWTTTPTGNLITHSVSNAGQSLLGGFIKIEKQNTAGVWSDVTAELLNLGFSGPNQEGTSAPCADPTPNAVIRLQRLRDSANPTAPCSYGSMTMGTEFWPNVLYDAREGVYRDVATTAQMTMGGVMNYVAIDIGNLKRWFSGAIGTTGNQALNNNGYIVYFTDRRGNHNDAAAGAPETGEYGNEDSINNAAGAGSSVPNAILEAGENRNEDDPPLLQTYGATASTVAGVVPTGAPGAGAYSAASTPLTLITSAPMARMSKQVLFRRALKLVNGCIGTSGTTPGCNAANGVNNLPNSGLTIATENGVYVQGNYNATSTNVQATPDRPAAILGDAITILSNNWSDVASLNSPNDMAARDATSTGYRFAMVAGKSIAFPRPGWATAGDWGTDGGVHNFMRMLENWGGQTISYRGSMISLYTARQMIGIYRANSNVYSPGTRAFAFDTNFLQPALLPPGTPMFRDVNTLRFRQILRPNQ